MQTTVIVRRAKQMLALIGSAGARTTFSERALPVKPGTASRQKTITSTLTIITG